MPLHEYRCAKGHQFDRLIGHKEDPKHAICECGATAERIYSAPAIHFRGSGFYSTDYKNKSKKDPPTEKIPPQDVKAKADSGT